MGPDPSVSGAARICPFSSRLVIELWRRRRRHDDNDEDGDSYDEKIVVQYNDMVLRVLDGGLAQWKADYAEALAVRYVG